MDLNSITDKITNTHLRAKQKHYLWNDLTVDFYFDFKTKMTLNNLGEFGFINRFTPKFQNLVNDNNCGIGDDCALIAINNEDYHLISTDLLIEDIHFLRNKITPYELGYKALAVNLSDIAAMGGKALYSFLSIGIPPNIPIEYLDKFMDGYHSLSEKHKVALMGGDTTKSTDKLIINIAVVGYSKKSDTHLRSMAKTGDIICTTGTLGDSAIGLKALLNNIKPSNDIKELIHLHHNPSPRLDEGLFLAKQKGVNAMMDISDGIASDLKHILNSSQKSAQIHLDQLPISPLAEKVAKENNWNIHTLATSGGEDYELLFTINKDNYENIKTAYLKKFNKEFYAIGEISEGPSEISWLKDGIETTFKAEGFNHFTE